MVGKKADLYIIPAGLLVESYML